VGGGGGFGLGGGRRRNNSENGRTKLHKAFSWWTVSALSGELLAQKEEEKLKNPSLSKRRRKVRTAISVEGGKMGQLGYERTHGIRIKNLEIVNGSGALMSRLDQIAVYKKQANAFPGRRDRSER